MCVVRDGTSVGTEWYRVGALTERVVVPSAWTVGLCGTFPPFAATDDKTDIQGTIHHV